MPALRPLASLTTTGIVVPGMFWCIVGNKCPIAVLWCGFYVIQHELLALVWRNARIGTIRFHNGAKLIGLQCIAKVV